ncbi:tetratricopeptide repeat protein [Dethiosulfatarculus sandiegensis]|uniref:Uncharacterized protein n=1 Tax=Dethiosulfatarculus sandiegensis TaxID=1429043 RepID=A0A0D2HJH4_9BACT|nr:tetratricopeptide repeat protein [Dethiosulfatarculus sandiegensis]KIX10813.1 hypothetical protein X474_28105 [Dethiosulfatarculus sandiegensis]
MLTLAIQWKNEELENKILKNNHKRHAKEEIIWLLNAIKYHVKNTENLDTINYACSLFRKWQVILKHFFESDNISPIDFNFSLSKYQLETKLLNYINSTNKKFYNDGELGDIKNLIESVDPYGSFKENKFKNIDPDLLEKYKVIAKLKRATDYFKQSELQKAQNLYINSIKAFQEEDKNDSQHLYLFSWALHGLGNIQLLCNKFELASQLFLKSKTIKERINKASKLMINASYSKWITSKIPSEDIDVSIKELDGFISSLKRNEYLKRENELWYFNIIIDCLYQAAKLNWYRRDKRKALTFGSEALALCRQFRDASCLIRLFIHRGIVTGKFSEITEKIDLRLKNMTPEGKKNPYIKYVIADPFLFEIGIRSQILHQKIKNVYSKYKIEPIKQNLYIPNDIPDCSNASAIASH